MLPSALVWRYVGMMAPRRISGPGGSGTGGLDGLFCVKYQPILHIAFYAPRQRDAWLHVVVAGPPFAFEKFPDERDAEGVREVLGK